jgi:hypothetical protein
MVYKQAWSIKNYDMFETYQAQQLLGAPDRSLPQEGAFAGQDPGGFYRCTGYQGISVHPLLGQFNGPASA